MISEKQLEMIKNELASGKEVEVICNNLGRFHWFYVQLGLLSSSDFLKIKWMPSENRIYEDVG